MDEKGQMIGSPPIRVIDIDTDDAKKLKQMDRF
jgi:hypothetical protein